MAKRTLIPVGTKVTHKIWGLGTVYGQASRARIAVAWASGEKSVERPEDVAVTA